MKLKKPKTKILNVKINIYTILIYQLLKFYIIDKIPELLIFILGMDTIIIFLLVDIYNFDFKLKDMF